MIEKHIINDTDIWVRINPHPVERDNAHIIPNEYFTAIYYRQDPVDASAIGVLMKNEEGQVALFESPVAALAYAVKTLQNII
ncbi:MAG: hypothetical protein LH478_15255 [Chitinophagaceae bacterium]|nr:hypothetical protein [Chitinophagaceae bacterium]